MFNSPIRRAQLIAPFGVGALLMTREGVSLICAGLDHWFDENGDPSEELDTEEFYVEEWRLQRWLDVDFFRLPPDFRPRTRYGLKINTNLTIPFLRFPTWHFCQRCGRMATYPLTERGHKTCNCQMNGAMVQVPLVAICDRGHIQDFPWGAWVHGRATPDCRGELKFTSTGEGGLRGLVVACSLCNTRRNLEGVLSADPSGDETTLSARLEKGKEYMCAGQTPWLCEDTPRGCGRPIRGALRSSTNIYYAQQASAIYLPRGGHLANPDLVDLVTRPPISQVRQIFGDPISAAQLRSVPRCAKLVAEYTDEQINEALILAADEGSTDENDGVLGDDPQTAFRRREFEALLLKRRDDQLIVSPVPIDEYKGKISQFFSSVSLVEKLRETRVLRGFTRVFAETDMDNGALQSLLRHGPPADGQRWLPGYVVHGEGIFLQLSEERLQQWEVRDDVVKRVRDLIGRYKTIQQVRHLRERSLSPRYILTHTLAHLLINRFTFESGYSTASLRERLFVSEDAERPMAAILLYTAAGDSEGTMGGLVRLGKPGFLEHIVRKSIEEARWCGADPVCMETGDMGGQGPDSCNIAACHNCALLPETSCEEFNRFLDRGVVVGSMSNPSLGFFRDL